VYNGAISKHSWSKTQNFSRMKIYSIVIGLLFGVSIGFFLLPLLVNAEITTLNTQPQSNESVVEIPLYTEGEELKGIGGLTISDSSTTEPYFYAVAPYSDDDCIVSTTGYSPGGGFVVGEGNVAITYVLHIGEGVVNCLHITVYDNTFSVIQEGDFKASVWNNGNPFYTFVQQSGGGNSLATIYASSSVDQSQQNLFNIFWIFFACMFFITWLIRGRK